MDSWGVIFVGILLLSTKWGLLVRGFEFDEFSDFEGNRTSDEVSFLESMSNLESTYGVLDATVSPSALMVGLTLIHGASVKGAGIDLHLFLKMGFLPFVL